MTYVNLWDPQSSTEYKGVIITIVQRRKLKAREGEKKPG
jgi:hypothetical protein